MSNASRVSFVNCTFKGGHGEGLYTEKNPGCAVAGHGGAGIQITSGTIALYDCLATGGAGGGHLSFPGLGGAGIQADGGMVFLSGCMFQGGDGGDCYFDSPLHCCGAVGADGCHNAATTVELGCTFLGGSQGLFPCGENGHPVSGAAVTSLFGPARVMTIAPLVAGDGDAWDVSCSGTASDHDYLLESLRAAVLFAPAFNGARLVQRSALLGVPFLGSGASLATTVPCPAIASGGMYDRRFVQLAVRSSGSVYLGSGAAVLIIDHASGPDCDGDGVNDFVEVIDDPSKDVNYNLIPDTCPGG